VIEELDGGNYFQSQLGGVAVLAELPLWMHTFLRVASKAPYMILTDTSAILITTVPLAPLTRAAAAIITSISPSDALTPCSSLYSSLQNSYTSHRLRTLLTLSRAENLGHWISSFLYLSRSLMSFVIVLFMSSLNPSLFSAARAVERDAGEDTSSSPRPASSHIFHINPFANLVTIAHSSISPV
jgi:hypothetical protein